MHITIDDDEDFGEYYSHDGTTVLHLKPHLTIWGIYDTLIHEALHKAIEETDTMTSEKQDHFIIQRLCF